MNLWAVISEWRFVMCSVWKCYALMSVRESVQQDGLCGRHYALRQLTRKAKRQVHHEDNLD